MTTLFTLYIIVGLLINLVAVIRWDQLGDEFAAQQSAVGTPFALAALVVASIVITIGWLPILTYVWLKK